MRAGGVSTVAASGPESVPEEVKSHVGDQHEAGHFQSVDEVVCEATHPHPHRGDRPRLARREPVRAFSWTWTESALLPRREGGDRGRGARPPGTRREPLGPSPRPRSLPVGLCP